MKNKTINDIELFVRLKYPEISLANRNDIADIYPIGVIYETRLKHNILFWKLWDPTSKKPGWNNVEDMKAYNKILFEELCIYESKLNEQ